MSATRLILVKQSNQPPASSPDTLVIDMHTVKAWATQRTLFRHLFRYRTAQGVTYHLDLLGKPLTFALLLRLFSHGRCLITDQAGREQPVTAGYLLGLLLRWARDAWRQKSVLRMAAAEVSRLQQPAPAPGALNLQNRPLYLRTDLVFGLQSGGSVGHIAGVLNHLGAFAAPPLFLTTDLIPTVDSGIETVLIRPDQTFRDFPELQMLAFNQRFFDQAQARLGNLPLAFVYQRYSLNHVAGLKLARARQVPFVLEFNGSEIWVKRNWGSGLTHEALAERIELANLHGAQVVVVVSQALKEELAARGIDPAKILVNPNGVDPEQYSPAIDGDPVRARYGLAGKTVIGFIGTFGPWHGAEVLAAAFARLLHDNPTYRGHVRLLMIGDGVTMPQVKQILAEQGVAELAVLTGSVPQRDGPAHLAACDLLISPHVPNRDGTPFFGSPTKLFEYMAMGRGIVASDLAQIGQVLAHGETAWLVKPGDVGALAAGMKSLLDDPALAQRLGAEARRAVLARHTWRAHTQRIVDKLIDCTD